MSPIKFQTPRGMNDILGPDWEYYRKIYQVVEDAAHFYNFDRIETPILENAELFTQGLGISTDVVQKEMFSLKTKGGDLLSLRPEGTAPVVRAYFEDSLFNLPQPVKLWYFGPFFRYERPQAGRYRQFWQFGFEILGESSYGLDVEIIVIFLSILEELKIRDFILHINTIGDNECRPYYKKALVSYFKSRAVGLCGDCKRRLRENPLRILDCKEEKCRQICSQGPQILDYLCDPCKLHFKKVLETLEHLGIPFNLNPFLVRGLDYYTKTVFEIESKKNDLTIIGGGRYDGLGKLIGKKELPAVGGAGGVERIVEILRQEKVVSVKKKRSKVFLAQIGDLAKMEALRLIPEFKRNNIPILTSIGKDSLKSQLKIADKLGIRYVLLLGQKEALEKEIILRDMETGKQRVIKLNNIIKEVKKIL